MCQICPSRHSRIKDMDDVGWRTYIWPDDCWPLAMCSRIFGCQKHINFWKSPKPSGHLGTPNFGGMGQREKNESATRHGGPYSSLGFWCRGTLADEWTFGGRFCMKNWGKKRKLISREHPIFALYNWQKDNFCSFVIGITLTKMKMLIYG